MSNILSAFGKLGVVALIAVAFTFGMVWTVVLSLRSPDISVPEVVNQSYYDGEKTLARAGLDIRERAKRYKPGVQPGVILDQSPRAGEVIKGGQTVAVIVSRAAKEGEKPPDETIIEERREERGTEGLDTNKNTNANANRRRNTNKNANGNSNSNASANANAGANTNAGGEENASGGGSNRNANAARPSNSNANAQRPQNSNRLSPTNVNTRPRTTTTTNSARPAGGNANHRTIP